MACQTVNTKDGVTVIATTAAAAYCATCGQICCNCDLCISPNFKGRRDVCTPCRDKEKAEAALSAKKAGA